MSLTDIQYDTIMRDYSRRRLANQELHERRLEEVYQAVPEVQRLDLEMTSLSIREARKRLTDGSVDSNYENDLRALSLLRTRALTDAGYPADYLEPVYDCPICRDTGAVNGVRCECFRRKLVALVSLQTGLDQVLEEENFEHLTEEYYSARHIDPVTGRSSRDIMTREVIPACRDFVDTFGREYRNLLLYGSCGTGKTFLSHCISAELIRKGFSVLYMTSFELFDTLGRDRFSYKEDRSPVVDSIFESDLLIIDDLGTELTNNFVSSELFQCLNERLMHKKSTIISTNLTLTEIHKRYSERVASRITDSFKLVKFVGDDIRTTRALRQGQGSRPV